MAILDWIADEAAGLDAQIARRAAEAILSDVISDDDDLMQPLDAERAARLLQEFLTQYLIRIIITPVESRLTDNAPAPRARQNEREIMDVVRELVRLDITPSQLSQTDWLGVEGATILESICSDALEILSGGEL